MTPTQGEHAQTEALRLADEISKAGAFPAYPRAPYEAAAAELRRLHAQVAALTAAPQGVAYAALPEKYYLAGGEVPTWDAKQMRAFADATHTLRASHGQAPAGATLRSMIEGMSVSVDVSTGDHDAGHGWKSENWVRKRSEAITAARGRLLDSDLSNLTECGAKAWARVDAQALREGFTAADMATASAQGFSDGAASVAANAGEPSGHIKEPYTLAEIKAKIAGNDYSAEMLLQHAMLLLDSASISASVGSELVYQARYQKGFWQDSSRERHEYLQNPENTCAEDWETRILYTHPPTAQAEGWQSIETAPKEGVFLVFMQDEVRPARRMQVANWHPNVKIVGGLFAFDCAKVTHWMPLPHPPTSAEGVGS